MDSIEKRLRIKSRKFSNISQRRHQQIKARRKNILKRFLAGKFYLDFNSNCNN